MCVWIHTHARQLTQSYAQSFYFVIDFISTMMLYLQSGGKIQNQF